MGTLAYGCCEDIGTIDDRLLAHLQVVIVDKLKRGERFPLSFVDSGKGVWTTVWLSPDIPIRFELTTSTAFEINRLWVAALARAAEQPSGLRILDEPSNLRPLPDDRFVGQGAEARV